MIDEKYQVASQVLYQMGGDVTEWHYQLNRIMSDFSQQTDSVYKDRQYQLEQEEIRMEKEYKRQHRRLEEELVQALKQERHKKEE